MINQGRKIIKIFIPLTIILTFRDYSICNGTSIGRKLLKAVYEWGPDIVHSQCEFSTFFVARKISKHLSIPLVHTYHTVYEDYVGYVLPGAMSAGKKFVRFFSKWEANRCSTFIAPTGKVEKIITKLRYQGKNRRYPNRHRYVSFPS